MAPTERRRVTDAVVADKLDEHASLERMRLATASPTNPGHASQWKHPEDDSSGTVA